MSRVDDTLERRLVDYAAEGAAADPLFEELRTRLLAEAEALTAAPPGRRRFARPRLRFALAAAACAIALAVFALARGAGAPAPASAETVLRAAAASAPASGEAVHRIYSLSVQWPAGGPTSSGTADVWSTEKADGGELSGQVLTISKAQSDPAHLLGRYVAIGDQVYGYDPAHNAILLPSARTGDAAAVVPNAAFDGTSVAHAATALERDGGRATLLGRRTFDGVPVDAIQLDGGAGKPALRGTFYFDAQTHELRGFDARSIDPSYPTPTWSARLLSSHTVPAGSAPADAFALEAPSDARIPLEGPDKTVAAVRSELDAAVAAGIIRPDQAQAALAAARARLGGR
jgi:hypothetical protein